MALDYAPSLDSHDVRRKIGIITEANIVPLHAGSAGEATGQLAVSGYLFAHDFPDVVDEIRAGRAGSTLGMSYEIARSRCPTGRRSGRHRVYFHRAAVLRRDKAAYPQTWIALETALAADRQGRRYG